MADFGIIQASRVSNAESKQWMTYYKIFWSFETWTTNNDTTYPKLRLDGDGSIELNGARLGKSISEYQARRMGSYEALGWRFGFDWVIQNGQSRPTLLSKSESQFGEPLSSQGKVVRVRRSLSGKLYYDGFTYTEMHNVSQTTRSRYTPIYKTEVIPVTTTWTNENVGGHYTEDLMSIYPVPNFNNLGEAMGFKLAFSDGNLELGAYWDGVFHRVGSDYGADNSTVPSSVWIDELTINEPDAHALGKTLIYMVFSAIAPDGRTATWDSIVDSGATAGRLWGALIDTNTVSSYLNTNNKISYEEQQVFDETATEYAVDYEYPGVSLFDTVSDPDLTLYFLCSGVTDPTVLNSIKLGAETSHTLVYDEGRASDVNYYYYASSGDDEDVPFVPLYDELLAIKLPNSVCHIVVYKDIVSSIKVRIKEGETMYISLVALGDVKASPIRVMTPQGVRALRMIETQDQI